MLALLVSVSAFAGGSASPPPPPPPAVDLSTLDPRADVQPIDQKGEEHPVRARFLTEQQVVEPGSTVRVGLHLTQRPGWHTYWLSPGDIGLPTQIRWTLPPGWSVGPHRYPTPQRFEAEGLVSYGYDDQVLLIADLQVPTDASGVVELRADAEWLVCKTSCIPGKASLTLPLEVGPEARPAPWAPLFSHYAAQHPKTPEALGLKAELVLDPTAVAPLAPFRAAIVLSGPEPLQPDTSRFVFAPIVGDGWMLESLELGQHEGALIARLSGETLLDEAPESDRIGGLFLLEHDGAPTAVLVEEPLPWGEGRPADPHPALASTLTPIPSLDAPEPPAPPDSPDRGEASSNLASASSSGLLANLFFAFVGGLILNIMPCVLPVLTLKLYSLVEQTDVTAREQRTAGLAYTAGILVSFLALGVAVLLARSTFGANVGWGFQFQYPPYVAALATVVFAFGLSLFGVFEIPAVGTSTASEAGMKEGPVGYFFTGVFATLLATPCSAPILGTATAFTLSASAPALLAIYLTIGLGLAAPFILIAFVPALYKFLPRPGAWMETFKELLGFTLMATALWLLHVLGAQIGMDRLLSFLVFLAFVGLGCWVFGRFGGVAAPLQRQLVAGLAGLVIASAGGWLYIDLAFAEEECEQLASTVTADELDYTDHIPWQPFSEARVQALAGSTIFIDFTAEWCLTCKVNEKTVLETAAVRTAMASHRVVPLKADWTRQDPTITAWLARYGKAGVPFYLVIPPKGDPIPLGEVITPSSVIAALEKAAGS